MPEHYTNESAAHLLLSMTRIVEKPEDCEALRKCLNQAVKIAVEEKDKEIDKLRRHKVKLMKRIVFISKLFLEYAYSRKPELDVEYAVFCPIPDGE